MKPGGPDKPKRLLIRTDANSRIGFGHAIRCVALAQHWHDLVGPVDFLSRGLPDFLIEQIRNQGWLVHSVSGESGSPDDARESVGIITQTRADAFVLDGYQFDPRFQQTIQSTGIATLVIDDQGTLDRYYTDLLLNQNTGINAELYRGRVSQSELMIGPKFALLRKEIVGLKRTLNSANHSGCRLLVTLGGSKTDTINRKIIDAISLLADIDLSVKLISHDIRLNSTDPRIDLVPFVQDMAELYRQTDLAICAGGSTNWELAWFGIPRLVVVLADNQSAIADSLDKLGCCHSLGWHDELNAATIAESLNQLLTCDTKPMQSANRELVDGRGAERVVRRLEKVCERIAID